MSTTVYSDIQYHFRGYARLNLASIELEDGDSLEADVKHLIKDFESRGCLQHDPAYAISVMVDNDSLAAVVNAQTDLSSRDETPYPHVDIKAICLHGKHRILAARIALQEHDKWWTARLFSSGR